MEMIAAGSSGERVQQKLARQRLPRDHELLPHLKILPRLLFGPGCRTRSERLQWRASMLMACDTASVTLPLSQEDGLHAIPEELVIESRPLRRRNRLLSK